MNNKKTENTNLKIISGSSFDKLKGEKIKDYRKKWRENPAKHIVERFPIHLDVETTSLCNLKCAFCATPMQKYKAGHMSKELYKKIIDEGSEKGLSSIKLNFRGEPLLHPDIAEMVAYAKEKGVIDVFFNSNATLLDTKAAESLIESGLDRLIVSFEGYTKDLYEKNRVGAKFEDVVANVKNFVNLKRKLKKDTPILRLQTVDISGEESYLKRYKDFWKDYADEITCIDLRDEAADYSGIKSEGWECPYPWTRLCVTWNGEILTCPFMNRALEKYDWKGFGNIRNIELESVWTGETMKKIREFHEKGISEETEPCKHCSYRGTELLKRKK